MLKKLTQRLIFRWYDIYLIRLQTICIGNNFQRLGPLAIILKGGVMTATGNKLHTCIRIFFNLQTAAITARYK